LVLTRLTEAGEGFSHEIRARLRASSDDPTTFISGDCHCASSLAIAASWSSPTVATLGRNIGRDTMGERIDAQRTEYVYELSLQQDVVPVTMRRTDVPPTEDQVLWTAIRNSTTAMSFDRGRMYLDSISSRHRWRFVGLIVLAFVLGLLIGIAL
jgi:hypothetical protein